MPLRCTLAHFTFHSALDELLQATQPHFGTRALQQAVDSVKGSTTTFDLPSISAPTISAPTISAPPTITPPSLPSLPDATALTNAAQSTLDTLVNRVLPTGASTPPEPHFGTRAAVDTLQKAADALQQAAAGNDVLVTAADALRSLQASVASAVTLPPAVDAAIQRLATEATALARTAQQAVALPPAPWTDGGVQRAADALVKGAASLQANGATLLQCLSFPLTSHSQASAATISPPSAASRRRCWRPSPHRPPLPRETLRVHLPAPPCRACTSRHWWPPTGTRDR